MEMRKAQKEDAALCYQCIEDARDYHKTLGFEQWHPDYPTQQTILDDIDCGTGFAFCEESGVIGYCCVIIGDEPAYLEIDGAWKTDRPYAVVHRMAFLREARGGGLSRKAFELIQAYCLSNQIRAIRTTHKKKTKSCSIF